MELTKSIKLLSDGTIGSLTGLNRYDEIEVFRAKFINFSENLNQEIKWQEAYKSYKKYSNKKSEVM